MSKFLQRSLIILAIALCCFESWTNAVDCEAEPYHKDCRGSQTRKRLFPVDVPPHSDCEDSSCAIPRIKFLIALLNDNLDKVIEYPSKKQRRRPEYVYDY